MTEHRKPGQTPSIKQTDGNTPIAMRALVHLLARWSAHEFIDIPNIPNREPSNGNM